MDPLEQESLLCCLVDFPLKKERAGRGGRGGGREPINHSYTHSDK